MTNEAAVGTVSAYRHIGGRPGGSSLSAELESERGRDPKNRRLVERVA